MNSNNNRTWLNILLIAGVFALCGCTTVAAFIVGRQSATLTAFMPAQELAVTETVEEVPTATPLPTATATLLPTDVPEPAATVLPLEAPYVEPERTPMPPMDRSTSLTEEDLAVFFEAWRIIAREYDGELPSQEELLLSAIRGSMETLDDQFTRFVPADIAIRTREDMRGSFEGIGAFVRQNEEGFLEIVRPMAGQPAAQAGLLPGDLILEANGVSLIGMSSDEAIMYVRGPSGTDVVLTIQRPGQDEPFQVTVTRQRIEIPTVEYEMLPDRIAYVKLNNFNQVAEQNMRTALRELMNQNPVGMIFDLRDNPGGYLDQSIAVADLFLPQGVVAYERNLRGLDETFQSRNGGPAEQIPLVVLVNAGSASASEIVAGAIQDQGRAVIIGETTFGKGSVQQLFNLSDGSELRVTIARWYTPANRSIDGEGIVPNIEELPSPTELGGPDDNQLQRAIRYLLDGE
jgi:carboxyl-terminal processing protease